MPTSAAILRVARSLAAIASGKVIALAGSVVLVPLFLARWSPTYYGEWLALASLTAYLTTLDFGMNMGAVNRLTQSYARGDLDEYRRIQRAGMAFYVSVATVGTVAVATGAATLPLARWLGLAEMSGTEMAWTTLILGAAVLWSFPSGLVTATYRTTGDLARSQWISNVHQVLVTTLVALALWMGARATVVALAQTLPLAATALYVLWHVRGHDPRLVPGIRGARWSDLRESLKPSGLFVLVTTANMLALQGVVLVISAALGGVAVAVYVTCRTLANVIRQFVNMAVIAVWPEITRLDASGQFASLRAMHSTLIAVSTTFGIGVAAAVWWEGAEIIAVWTRGALQADVVVLRLLLVILVLQSPWLVSSVFTAAANRHRAFALCLIVSSVLGLVLAAILVRVWGAVGAAAGMLAGDVMACSHLVVKSTCEAVGEPYGAFARRLWPCLATTGLLALAAGWLVHTALGGPMVLRWLATLTATSAVAAASGWTMWLTASERRGLVARIGPLIGVAGARA